jgi:phosphatidylethanolamine/phosphatidyl-N-methylethanolamine N-methyltransferase
VRRVIEYGPGTGAFTPAILRSLRDGARYCAIEINPLFVKLFQEKFPQASIYNDSVGRVEHVCRQEAAPEIDAVICGLPWANFSERDQNTFFDALLSVLRPGGSFATFAYIHGVVLPAGMRLKKILASRFGSVKRSQIVWGNLPPAFVYRCVR